MAHYLGAWLGLLGPAIYRFTSGARSPYVLTHATAAFNFQLTMLVYAVIAGVLSCCFGVAIGVVDRTDDYLKVFWVLLLPLFLALAGWHIAASCMAGSAARKGRWFHYRGSFEFVQNPRF